MTVDVSTVLLQGIHIDRPHPVWVRVRPLREANVALGLVWQLAKCAYGLVDAPLLCYWRVCEQSSLLGATRTPSDPDLFVLCRPGTFILAVAVHVDDLLFGETTAGVAFFKRESKDALSVGPFGSGSLVFTGIAVSFVAPSTTRPASAWDQQQAYVDCLDDIPLTDARLAIQGAAVTTEELTLYRRAIGALLCAVGQSLSHLACSAAVSTATFVTCLYMTSSVPKSSWRRRAALGTWAFASAPCRTGSYSFTESSALSLRSSSTQSGLALALKAASGLFAASRSSTATEEAVEADLVAWGSRRQRRVTLSSYAAEALSLLQALHAALDIAVVPGLLIEGASGKGPTLHAVADSRAL